MCKVSKKFKVLCVNNEMMVVSANFELIGTVIDTSYTIGKEYICEIRDNPRGAMHYVLNDYGNYEYVSNHIYSNFDLNFVRLNQKDDMEVDSSLKMYIIICALYLVCSILITLN